MNRTHVFSGFSMMSAGAAASAALARSGGDLGAGGGEMHVSIVDIIAEPGGGWRAVVKVVFDDAVDMPVLMPHPGEDEKEEEKRDLEVYLAHESFYRPETDFFAATHPANDYDINELLPVESRVPRPGKPLIRHLVRHPVRRPEGERFYAAA